MKYESGDVYFTASGAFLFIGPETDIKLVTLHRVDGVMGGSTRYMDVSTNSHNNNIGWLKDYSDVFKKINISSIIKENWYDKT